MKWQVSLRRILASIGLFSFALACGRLAATNGPLTPIEVTVGVALLATSAAVLFRRPFAFGVALTVAALSTLAVIVFFCWAVATDRLH